MTNESKLVETLGLGASVVALLVACTGNPSNNAGQEAVGGAGASMTAGGLGGSMGVAGASAGNGAATALDCSTRELDPGPSPMRLLSRQQYLNTVRGVLGDATGVESALGPVPGASAFGLLQPDVTQVELEHYQSAAELIAAAVVADPARLEALAPCPRDDVPRECAKSLVTKLGARLYRAPLTDTADIERHVELFGAGVATSYAHGIELLLRGMLQSPRFLYRVEVGAGARVSENAVKLSPHELAARLAYTIWDAPPDERLVQAAGNGELEDAAGVEAQLSWMLEDARGRGLVNRFLESWMHVEQIDRVVKNSESYPEFQSASFRQSLKDQARAFFDDLLNRQGGTLQALFQSQTVFYNRDLGAYYGVTGTDAFRPLERTDGTAAGILTLPVVLAVQSKADESSPIYRGRFVREALLCQQLPAPPANIPPAPTVMPGVSTRDRSAQHQADPSCSGCHLLLDQVGFGFEHYDALGRFRMEDGGKRVDASGELVRTLDANGPFRGVVELAERLAGSAEVKECVARQWFRFALNRFEQPADVCSMKSLVTRFDEEGKDMRTLPRALVQTDAFLYRRPLDSGVGP